MTGSQAFECGWSRYRLVDTDVPDGIVWNPTNNPPDPEDCL